VNLDEELVSAWATVAPPTRSAITEHDCAECDEISDFFAGELWTDLDDVAALRYHCDALHLFAASAYHYYLPAFIRAAFVDPHTADRIPDTIVYTLRLEFGDASRERLELFSSSQRAALASALRTFLTRDYFCAEDIEDVSTMADLLAG
jgi:hypothetical protein